MPLKDAFYQNSTGLLQKMKDAHDAAVAWVGTATAGPVYTGEYLAIQTGLTENAAKGLRVFTVSIATTYLPTVLRGNSGNNLILKAYLSGITEALSTNLVYSYECTPALNTTDPVITKIDLNFNFV